MTSRKIRDNHGSVFALAFVGMVPLLIALAAFGVDTLHYSAVQAEVQRACDAGALAGAQDLYEYFQNPNGPPQVAIAVAGMNESEGQMTQDIANVNISASVETPPTNDGGGTVRCNMTVPYNNLLAAVFGANRTTISCTALAGAQGTGNVAATGSLFPLAISMGIKAGQDNEALQDKQVGDTIYLEWHNNIEWTGFKSHNARDVRDYITNYMQPGSGNPSPPVPINSAINVTHGVQATNIAYMEQLLDKKIIYMPVIADSGSLGPGDYNVLGFIGLKGARITGNGSNSVLEGTLIGGVMNSSYDPSAGNWPTTGILGSIKIQPAKLLQ